MITVLGEAVPGRHYNKCNCEIAHCKIITCLYMEYDNYYELFQFFVNYINEMKI